ncbi:PH and SEC7 domain-containing protein 2 isoform 1-T2 [Synchiropus picturatus]
MEDERSVSPQLDSSDSSKPRPSGCPAEHINGHYEDVRSETAVRFHQELATEQTNGEEQGHNADQWEEISWSAQPLTGSAASMSFATVQWDLPQSAPVTEEGTSVGFQKPQDFLSQLLTHTGNEEDEFDVWMFSKTTLEMNGSHIKPCDAAEEEEPQKGEDLLHKLVNSSNGVTVRSDSGGKSHSIAVEAVSLTDILVGTADVLQVEEEEEDPDILLRRKWESEDRELISFNGVHTCEGHEDEGDGTRLSTQKPSDTREASAIRSEASEVDAETKEGLTVAARNRYASSSSPNMTGNLCGDNDQTTTQDVSTSMSPERSKVEVTHAGDQSDASALVGQKQPLTQTLVQAETSAVSTQSEQMETPEWNGSWLQATRMSMPPTDPQKTDESGVLKHLSSQCEVTRKKVFQQMDPIAESAEQDGIAQDGGAQTNAGTVEPTSHHMNGHKEDSESARNLAERLFKLDGIQRVEVARHLDKDNDFSRAVGEEYLRFFDFSGQDLDHALRSFLKVIILIGETQERERVLQHFARRFHECNPESFSSSGAVLALTCALMLLNTDLHGQNIGKSMSSSKFVSNLDGMNDGENFSKDLLKTLFNSIKCSPLEWAVGEEELRCSVLGDEEAGEEAALRSKSNPFQDLPHDKTAPEVKQGFLLRKIHADIDGKRTPWGKRGWRTFYGVLKGMVLYLKKDDYKREQQQVNEEAVSVHHSLAEQAVDYTKKPHVFRLQTADWRVFLFQASSKMEMNSWISRINLVSALRSSPPFPAAVGSQRRFCRPILPASQSAHTLERQLQSAAGMLQSFQADLSHIQQNPPESRKAKARELEEHRVRAQYLQHEMCRYQNYMYVLQSWKKVKKTEDGEVTAEDLSLFEKVISADLRSEDDEAEGGLKKSHSSPSLELETAPPAVVKVRRNISERRTYRRPMVPRWNKEA